MLGWPNGLVPWWAARIATMSQAQSPIDVQGLVSRLAPFFRKVVWRQQTGSTNADLAAYAALGEEVWPDLSVLMVDSQIAGKGRLGRIWEVPQGSSMISSVLLRPDAGSRSNPDRPESAQTAFHEQGYGWLSILAGVALCQALRQEAGVQAQLKWPNDVLVNGRKLAGILAQLIPAPSAHSREGPSVVVGLGMNVSQDRANLPVDHATSLRLEHATQLDRNVLLPAYLTRFARLYQQFVVAGGRSMEPLDGGESLHQLATDLMVTLGKEVRAELPGHTMIYGRAVEMAPGGELVVEDAQGLRHVVSAADVVHLRRLSGPGQSGPGTQETQEAQKTQGGLGYA